MKKILSICAALVSAITMSAVQVTLNFSTADGLAAMNVTPATIEEGATQGEGVDFVSAAVDGVTITADKGSNNKNAPRVWTNLNKSTELRCYNGNTLVIKGALESDKITQIAFTGGDLKFSELTNGQWTSKDGANSVTFTATATCKVSTIIITMNEEAVEYKPDTISVSKAIDLIKNDAALAAKAHYVKGVVAGDPFLLGNNGPAFYMTDIKNDKDSLEGFKIGKDANTAYKDVEEMSQDIAMGDTILIYANSLAQYGKIFETTGGYFCETLGKFKAIELDWAAGEATRFADHWELSIAKVSGNEQNVIKLAFASDKVDAIAGNHYLAQGSSITIDGAETAITSGSVKLTFKEQGGTGLNTYVTKVKAAAGDDIYVLSAEIEFYAQDEEFEEIDLVGDRPFVPTVDGQDVTCEQARSYALSLDAGASSDLTVTVHGFVTDLFSNGVTFWMADQQGTEKVIQAYSSVLPVGVALQNGTEVKVKGKVTNYNGTPEINKGTVEVISGGGVVTVLEVNVAEALAACQALAQNATSTETYAITGFIINIAREYSEQYGNMSFWMSDNASDEKGDFEAYNVKCDATLAAKLLPGAKVKVTDKLKHFHQDATEGDNPKPERTVYETLGGGSVELLAGAGVEDITVNVKAAKFIYDGQLYILRDNAIYNVQGQRVK